MPLAYQLNKWFVNSFCIMHRDRGRIEMVQDTCIRLVRGLRGRRGVTGNLFELTP